MFPFLCILIGFIGILMLLIQATSLTQMVDDKPAEIARDYAATMAEVSAEQVRESELTSLIEGALAVRAKLDEANAGVGKLAAERTAAVDEKGKVIEERRRLDDRKASLERECARLEAEIANGEAQIQKLELAKKSADTVHIRGPKGGVTDLKATFIECTEDALVVQPKGTRIRKDDIGTDESLKALLEKAKSSPEECALVFLIRPDAIPTFDEVELLANKRDVKIRKLPLPGFGKLDLSAFGGGG
jgi:hypothetical protein